MDRQAGFKVTAGDVAMMDGQIFSVYKVSKWHIILCDVVKLELVPLSWNELIHKQEANQFKIISPVR